MIDLKVLMICIIGVSLSVGLFSLWLFPFLERQTGPWLVKRGREFLIYHPPGQFTFTLDVKAAEHFPSRSNAITWAEFTGGVVISVAEVEDE